MTLIAFTPIFGVLSKQIDVLPWIGEVDHALSMGSNYFSLRWNLLLAAVGIKLPGIEYDIQKEEAGYRKELVLGEDDPIRAAPPTIGQFIIELEVYIINLIFIIYILILLNGVIFREW